MSDGLPRVLVADDEPQLLRVVVRALEQRGHSVLAAACGDEALQAFRAGPERIAAVVLDAAIGPDGAGPVLAEVLRERPGVGVVVTSGGGLAGGLQALLERHSGVFLPKPFRPRALFAAVDDAIARSGDRAI